MWSGTLLCFFMVWSGHGTRSSADADNDNSSLRPTPLELYRENTNGGLLAIYDTANWWLETAIQSRTLDYLPDNGFTDWSNLKQDWEVLAVYLVGYIIVALVGILAFVGMMFAACLVPCCRCCSCCGGGTRKPRDSKRDAQRSCYRICCGVWLSLFLCATALGSIAMFGVNEELKRQLVGKNSVFTQINYVVKGIPDFLDQTLTDINETLYVGAVETTDEVMGTLYKVPSEAITALDNQTGLSSTFAELGTFSNNLESINAILEQASMLSEQLLQNTTDLAPILQTIQTNINSSLISCTDPQCTTMINDNINSLGVEINMTDINTRISILTAGVAAAIDSDFTNNVAELNDTINNITRDLQDGFDSEIDDVQAQIDKILGDILQDINKFGNTIDDLSQRMEDVSVRTDEWQNTIQDNGIDTYVYFGIIGLAAIPCLIVTLSLIGLLHGFCKGRAHGDTDCCHVDRSTGSNCLFSGIGFTFTFYWLFSLLTMVLFLGGGLTQTEVCRYIVDYDNPKYTGAIDVIENVTQEFTSLNVNGVPISIMSTYNSCRYDETVYNALPVEEMGLDIGQIANLSSLEDIINQLKETPIPLPDNVQLLTPQMNTSLYTLDDVMNEVNLTKLLQELTKNITSPADLNQLADDLDNLIGLPGVDNDTLASATAQLRSTYIDMVVPAEATKQEIYRDIYEVNTLMGSISFAGLAVSLAEAENVINTQGDEIVGGVVNSTADQVYDDLSLYIDDSVYAVKNTIGKCFPLYNSTATAINIVCVSTLYQINGLALALGWILFFLMFVIIFSFKVADHYRRTVVPRHNDRYDETVNSLSPVVLPGHSSPAHTEGTKYKDNAAYQMDDDVPANLSPPQTEIENELSIYPDSKYMPPPSYYDAYKQPYPRKSYSNLIDDPSPDYLY